MKATMLKLAGVKTEAAFYKKYPTQEAFMKVHGKAFKKAQIGTYIGGETAAKPKLLNYQDAYDQGDMAVTGKTNKIRQEEASKQAALAADTKQAQPDQGGTLGVISKVLGGVTDIAGQLSEGEGGNIEGMLEGLGDARYGKRINKAQFGNMFTRGFNPGNTQVPSGISKPSMSTNLTSSGFQMPNTAQSFASNNPLPASVPNMKLPGTNSGSGAMGKIAGAVGKYAGPVGDLIGGLQALKAEKAAVKGAQQTRQLSDLSLQAANSKPEQTQRKYVRPEDMITSGNQVGGGQGTGTNILAQKGIKIPASGAVVNKGKIKKELNKPKNPISTLPDEWDIRDSKDVINLPSYVNDWDTNAVRTTSDAEYKSLKSNLGKLNKKSIEMESAKNLIDWYENPKTVERFPKNSGMDPRRLQDFMGKALRTPIEQYSEYVDHYAPMPTFTEAQFSTPGVAKANQDNPQWHNTGFMTYREGVDSETLEHERVHSSGLDLALAPALYKALGKSMPTENQRGDLPYMDRPEEMYANFHHFRRNLGFKPGEKTTADDLLKRYKKAKEEAEKSGKSINENIWQEMNIDSYDEKTQDFKSDKKQLEKLAKAINTVAYNSDKNNNATYAEDGAEIQNTYAPDTLYDDLGYEPLMDSAQVKKYQDGGTPWGMISDKATGLGQDLMGGQNAGGQIGKTAGKAIGNMIVPGIGGAIGGFVGGIAGNALDPNAKRLAREQEATGRNMQAMAFGTGVQGLQAQNASVMEDGGYVSNDWTPQVIAKFGDHSPEDVYDFAHEGMDSLRAGGHLRAYRDPSERAMQTFAMGGELKTHWGGHMEEMSENPYLPDGGVTYMPHGQSHDEADGNGRTGIGITYGDNPVEVERREPIMKLRDGSTGEDNLVVFGNLEIPKYGVDMLGDKKAKGMKFKNYVSDLSKSETKQNKTIQKSADELADLDQRDSFDKLKFAGLQANVLGGNMKLKEIAQTKEKAAALQNAINDTAEEFGVDADSLAKGKVKTVKMGGQFTKAQYGGGFDKYRTNFISEPNSNSSAIKLDEVKVPIKKIDYMRKATSPLSIKGIVEPNMTPQGSAVPESAGRPMNAYEAPAKYQGKSPRDYSWIEAINSVMPSLRPSDAEDLNRNQLLGEMYALSNNQEEPVQAQQFSPQLINPYSISLQDQMNEITAQTRAAQRMAQGNPSAQAAITAQAYEAINKVKGEEFRMNQGLANQVQTANIAAMNDAKIKNLGILDQQYTRQAQAKSNTKAVTQAALNSISDKYAKNALENRTLKTYENMYNYRYDANGRAINMNGVAQYNIPTVGSISKPKDATGDDLLPVYDKSGDIVKYMVKQDAKTKTKSRNGSIVKSIKNL
jgi:hypothetical protein